MKLLLISDVHFGKDLVYPIVGDEISITFGSKFSSLFEKIIPKLNTADILVNLGDSIAAENPDTDIRTFRKFLDNFKDVKTPICHVIGNHDGLNLTRNQLIRLINQPNNYFSFDLNGFHHVVLDSKWEGCPKALDNDQISWLKNDLGKTNNISIIYLHYPCDEQNMENNAFFRGHEKWVFVQQKEALRKIFEKYKVKLVIFGHTHYYHLTKINGITYLNVPSFTQNDARGKPCGAYTEVTINSLIINVDIKNVETSNDFRNI